jgi:hypothetical protein
VQRVKEPSQYLYGSRSITARGAVNSPGIEQKIVVERVSPAEAILEGGQGETRK